MDTSPDFWVEKEFFTFADNQQEADEYANQRIPEIVTHFNLTTKIKGHSEDIRFIKMEEVKV
jgi:hypothetical protein